MVMSFLYDYYRSTLANGVIHRNKSTGVRSDGMIKPVLLFVYILILWLVSLMMSA